MKVLVIEDEALIRRGMIKKVKWEKFRIDQVLEADNGEAGLEIILNENPEIVILDICLPRLNGMELLKKIREERIPSKVIILSGHDEFEYAQQAIQYGVDTYLLKPSSSKEIEDVLQKVCASIKSNIERERYYEELKKKLDEMIPFFKTGLINSIVTGSISNEKEAFGLLSYFNINIKNECYIAAVILMEKKHAEIDNLEESLINNIEIFQLIHEIVDSKDILIDSSAPGKILLLFSGSENGELQRKCFLTVDSIVAEISKKTRVAVAVGIGNTCCGIGNIKNSHNEALLALENRFADNEENRIYFYGDMMLDSFNLRSYPYEDEKKFLSFVKVGRKENSIEHLNRILHFLKAEKDNYPVSLIKVHLRQLVFYMIQIIYELGGELSDLYENANIMVYVGRFTHIDEYRNFLNEFTGKLCDYISKKRYLKHNSILRKMMDYIEQNYTDETMGLDKISEYVAMHPNYVSHLFKKERGESLTAYICRFRIKKAEELIRKENAVKISDIAYKVGFNDAHYFTTCFKSITGVTPSEYRVLNSD